MAVVFEKFDEEVLGMAIAEVETGGFEHEALKADDGAGVGFEDLRCVSTGLVVLSG